MAVRRVGVVLGLTDEECREEEEEFKKAEWKVWAVVGLSPWMWSRLLLTLTGNSCSNPPLPGLSWSFLSGELQSCVVIEVYLYMSVVVAFSGSLVRCYGKNLFDGDNLQPSLVVGLFSYLIGARVLQRLQYLRELFQGHFVDLPVVLEACAVQTDVHDFAGTP
ncbi:unnamed protein product [Mesocestoides corti]|uniref:Uncharacterized protein n=1 Tax=Mesocestoides corti TaxID=53468 RepID=A0A0R3UC22_MESCO|nr:unnamed protein product [Mesocestoides corti]